MITITWSTETEVTLAGAASDDSDDVVDLRAYKEELRDFDGKPKAEAWRLGWFFNHKAVLNFRHYCNKEDAKELLAELAPYCLRKSK